jgi:hypothetical protein
MRTRNRSKIAYWATKYTKSNKLTFSLLASIKPKALPTATQLTAGPPKLQRPQLRSQKCSPQHKGEGLFTHGEAMLPSRVNPDRKFWSSRQVVVQVARHHRTKNTHSQDPEDKTNVIYKTD